MQGLQSLHVQCVSGTLEVRWVHLPPTLQALRCDYCAHVHRNGDAQTIHRAALFQNIVTTEVRWTEAFCSFYVHFILRVSALCMRRQFFARKVLCAAEMPGDTGYIENDSFSIISAVWSRISSKNTHCNRKNYSPSYVFIQSVSVWAPSALLSAGFQPFFSRRPQTCWHVTPNSNQADTASTGRVLHLTCHRCQVLVQFLVCQTITQIHTPNKTKKTR